MSFINQLYISQYIHIHAFTLYSSCSLTQTNRLMNELDLIQECATILKTNSNSCMKLICSSFLKGLLLIFHCLCKPIRCCLGNLFNNIVYLEAKALYLSVPHRKSLSCCNIESDHSQFALTKLQLLMSKFIYII